MVEVFVFGLGLRPALFAVEGEVLAVEVAGGGGVHVTEEGAVEAEVVAVVGEEVVAGEGGVGLEFVVAVEAGLAAGEERCDGGALGGVAADGEFHGDGVAVGEGEAEGGEQDGEVPADVVDVLLGVDELVECGDAVVCEAGASC